MHTSDVKIFFPVVDSKNSLHSVKHVVNIKPNNSANSTSSTKTKIKSSDDIRRGKWTSEEESYAIKLIEAFNAGLLELPDEEVASGLTLRAFLAQRLCCDPMRITKKFSGDYCLGKRNYHNSEYIDPVLLETVRNCLRMLENKFRIKDLEVRREKMSKEEIERNKFHPVMDYDHMISSPAIDAMVLKVPAMPGQPQPIAAINCDEDQPSQSIVLAEPQPNWGLDANFSSTNQTQNSQLNFSLNAPQYGFFFEMPQQKTLQSSAFVSSNQYDPTAPIPNLNSLPPDSNYNHLQVISNVQTNPMDADFADGYGNIDIPVDVLHTQDTHLSDPLITKNDSQLSMSLSSDFSFSMDSTMGFGFMSSASLNSGFGFSSTNSLAGIMSAFMNDETPDNADGERAPPVTSADEAASRHPSVPSADVHLYELSYNLHRSVSLKGLDTESSHPYDGSTSPRKTGSYVKLEADGPVHTSSSIDAHMSDACSTNSSTSTSSRPHYIKEEPGEPRRTVSTTTSSGPPAFFSHSLSVVVPSPPRSDSSFSVGNVDSSWRSGAFASVKRNRSVNEWSGVDMSAAVSSPTTAPQKIRRTTSASGLHLRGLDTPVGRRSLFISLRRTSNRKSGVVRRSLSCSVLYEAYPGARCSPRIPRSLSQNVVVSQDFYTNESCDENYWRSESMSAICI